MDDILAKKNRHLFLEEKDNTHNSFISNINYAVENIDIIKTFNNNVNSGTMQHLLETYIEHVGTEGNAWVVKLTELGENILATTSGFNYASVLTATQDIEAGATITLPEAMKYRIGTHMLLVSWNGTVCYNGEQYEEVGAFNERSTVIKIKQDIKAGDKLEFRTVALADTASVNLALGDAITSYAFPVNSSNTERTLEERFSDTVNIKDFGAKGDGIADDTDAINAAVIVAKERNTKVDGSGAIYKMTSLPDDFSWLRNLAVNCDGVLYPSADFLNLSMAKVSDGGMYTAWPQDKAYVIGNQIRVWSMITLGHASAATEICCFISTDGGISYSLPTMLGKQYMGKTLWCAGTDGEYEYLFVRNTNVSLFSYTMLKREAPTGYSADDVYNDHNPWTETNIQFPTGLDGEDVQPVMIHSFCSTSNGRLIIGASFTNGAGLYYSDDQGLSWTFKMLLYGSEHEEPTVKCEGNIICGFIRDGNTGEDVRFWISRDNLSTISTYTMPSDFLGGKTLQDACINLAIKNGVVHAFTAQRNGTLAETGDDRIAPIYYFTGDVSEQDNFWSVAKCYCIGYLDHYELNGASALGQGSVVVYRDKILYYFGNEEIKGKSVTGNYNNTSNLYCACLSLKQGPGVIGSDGILIDNRASTSQFRRDFSGRTYAPVGVFVVQSSTYPAFDYSNENTAKAGFIVDGGASSRRDGLLASSGSADSGWMVQNLDSTRSGMRVQNAASNGNIVWQIRDVSILQLSASALYPTTTNAISLGDSTHRFLQASFKGATISPESIRPNEDAVNTLGTAALRWASVHAATGTINTSDEREKEGIKDPSEALMNAWGKVRLRIFQFKDAVNHKGAEAARLHAGVIAQQVQEAFASEGLDASRYGLFCYDKWDDVYEEVEVIDAEAVIGSEGNIISPRIAHTEKRLLYPKGDRFAIRYEEALILECAYQRWLGEQRDAKIEALMQRISALENNH